MGKPEKPSDVGAAAQPFASNNPFRRLVGRLGHSQDDNDDTQSGSSSRPSKHEDYAPPPGPPPSHGSNKETYAPPPGPPPSYHPPPGPPPSHSDDKKYAPPAGPPPSHEPEPPPYENWFSIPDNSTLPPPPTHNPSTNHQPYTIYYELKILSLDLSSTHDAEVSSAVALGFAAPPYPSFRLPGWERASMAVHSDDGRRYINDNCGGRDFTSAFSAGEVVGVGMTFTPSLAGTRVECFLTREGRKVGSWDLHEERDAGDQVGDPRGLGGERDICAAIGFWGATEFEFRARRDEWLFRPVVNWDEMGMDFGRLDGL
ncbi:hypothetical protein K461DRAFT_266596 [Myriangium duriaei CBS 260.36]|uniref:SPRY domain-containing protein n=1 Tax=Myriangium duriaei CBS 260.36 TaxID=1168546 RepID=A0A9P4J8C9_9PEZI|nr:hypothetical protein K461DRAFT_266596 [Myriangium duriaei CBS 260.36]